MLQSPVRSRLSTPNKKSHEKPSSKKERFLLLCSLLELYDLFPTCTPPEQLEPKSAAGSATRHAKRVKRWPGSAHDSCEICARVAANVYAKMNPARLSRRVYVARVANPRLPKRASDYAGLSHLEKVLQKKEERRVVHGPRLEESPRSFEQKRSRKGVFAFNQTRNWWASARLVIKCPSLPNGGVSTSGREPYRSNVLQFS
jgi:hypothetical protein